ncbi:hypothetical protein HMPREF3088_05915 [Corynebacterium sp. HMSC22B11]|uniref:LapA family protein n=1 Tax=Corynebacterium sp. HMSC22B11 TaxID=1581056 RepID=UPI0008A1EC19|nr:lipopolysaccharide assembly protein LapA domain-containing protein [Corynebacterium sp. HMSC22B11]OFO13211.1 hypothetical protein HMPREF3088_05915 [Corynebacterium sp. HMSC22B11]
MTNPGTNPQNPDFQPADEAFNEPPADAQLPAEPAAENNSATAPTQGEVAPVAQAEQHKRAHQNVKGSVAASTWAALIIGALVLILLLVFILQNQTEAQLVFFGWEWSFPIGIGMLIAAIAGALIMAMVGIVRMTQLRRQIKRGYK